MWVIIPAAGVSSRMKSEVMKPYLVLGDKSVLQHVLELFLPLPILKKIIVCVSPKDKEWQKYAWLQNPNIQVALGGDYRHLSVLNGLEAISSFAEENDWVMVHDAARPCLNHADLTQFIQKVQHHPVGGILGAPVTDTLKRVDENGQIVETVSRTGLWQAFTPQMFRFGILKKALQQVSIVTDEAQAIEQLNLKPLMIEGSRHNIKITYPEDLLLATSPSPAALLRPLPQGERRTPNHVAIIMDGNGRWAKLRHRPRIEGHRVGLKAARRTVEYCVQSGISALTLFAFSSENWQRPQVEVDFLMRLFLIAIRQETSRLVKNKIQIKFIGDHSKFSDRLQKQIKQLEALTHENTGLKLRIAANYGGRWDILQAAQQWALHPDKKFEHFLSLSDVPEPDLFIRTGNEQRISNFLLWQLAYTELYFTETLWPDFGEQEFNKALASFAARQRRYGKTGEQVT